MVKFEKQPMRSEHRRRLGSAWGLLLAPLLLSAAGISGCRQSESEAVAPDGPKIVDPLVVRDYAYSFDLTDLHGRPVSLKDFRGKLVLLNFWATWCAPCVAEMPALEALYERYKHRGLEIVAISIDDPRALGEVRAFVLKQGLSFPIVLDPAQETVPQYLVSAFPETFFVAPTGRLAVIKDPDNGQLTFRLSRERPWKTETYTNLVESLLKAHLPHLQPRPLNTDIVIGKRNSGENAR